MISNYIEVSPDRIEKVEKKEKGLRDLIFSIIRWFKFLISKWMLLLGAGIIGGGIGIFIAYRSPVTYSANLSFVLEEGKSSGGGLSAIAGQFGVDLNSLTGGSSNMLAGDNIVGLLKSRKFVEMALLSPYDSKHSLADKYAESYKLKSAWKSNSRIGKEIFFPAQSSVEGYSRLQDSLLQVIEENIVKKELQVERADKKMSFFTVSSSFRDELLSKYFTERLVSNAVNFYIDTKTKRQRANIERLQRRADSIGFLLNRKTYTAAAARGELLDVNPAYQATGAYAEVSSRDKMMLGTIYGEVVKNLEIQKASLSQETPTIQVVDDIMLPLKVNKKSKFSYLILGGFFSIFITSACLIIIRWLKN
jgi:hypothetical protein